MQIISPVESTVTHLTYFSCNGVRMLITCDKLMNVHLLLCLCPVAGGSQKSSQLQTAAVQFGQLVGQANAQSQLCVQYETAAAGQPGLATSPVAQTADPLLAAGQPSQIIGSQLVQQRSVFDVELFVCSSHLFSLNTCSCSHLILLKVPDGFT